MRNLNYCSVLHFRATGVQRLFQKQRPQDREQPGRDSSPSHVFATGDLDRWIRSSLYHQLSPFAVDRAVGGLVYFA
ncbi:hypothetical protein GN956_G13209 [Arapaima gigas]